MKLCLLICLSFAFLTSCSGPSGSDGGSVAQRLESETPEAIALSEVSALAVEVNKVEQYQLEQEDLDALKSEEGLLTDDELKEIESLVKKEEQ